jgi:hypothetical protein
MLTIVCLYFEKDSGNRLISVASSEQSDVIGDYDFDLDLTLARWILICGY